MPPHRIPHHVAIRFGALSHVVMVGGAIALYMTGKIDGATFAAIMAGFGGLWSGVAGVLISTRQASPSTAPGGATTAPSAPATPVSSPAAPHTAI